MGGDHLYPLCCKLAVEWVAIVGLVADELLRQLIDDTTLQEVVDELRFISLTTRNPAGDRKAVAVCHCHDLGRFAAASDANQSAPLFAPAWEPSTYASVKSSFPRSRKSSARPRSSRSSVPVFTHCWKRRWQVWYGGYLRGKSIQGAPVLRIHRTPFSTSRGSRHGRPFCLRSSVSGPGMNLRTFSHCSSVRSIPQWHSTTLTR